MQHEACNMKIKFVIQPLLARRRIKKATTAAAKKGKV